MICFYERVNSVSRKTVSFFCKPQWQLRLDKEFLSLVPKADSKIVQLYLVGVAVVFFSFISYLQICFFLYIFMDQLASMLI